MLSNVPDDWDFYYTRCSDCGSRYHLSEGGCGCYEERREHKWGEVLDRLEWATIDDVQLETATHAMDDELGDDINKGGLYIWVAITEPRVKPKSKKDFVDPKNTWGDELSFTTENWDDVKKFFGLEDLEDNEE